MHEPAKGLNEVACRSAAEILFCGLCQDRRTEAEGLTAVRDQIPVGVYAAIESQYREAEPVTSGDYLDGEFEEDSITGAMMKGLREAVQGEHEGHRWHTHLTKLRGRGPGALENRTGADVIVEFEVWDEEQLIAQKGLLGQAKKNWRTRDGKLVAQAKKMEAYAPKASVVVDYTENGASACLATEVIEADGRVKDLPEAALKPFGVLLADDFLSCSVGQVGMSYDRARGDIVFAQDDSLRRLNYDVGFHLLTTLRPTYIHEQQSDPESRVFSAGDIVRVDSPARFRQHFVGVLNRSVQLQVHSQLPDGYVRLVVDFAAPWPTGFVDVHPADIEHR